MANTDLSPAQQAVLDIVRAAGSAGIWRDEIHAYVPDPEMPQFTDYVEPAEVVEILDVLASRGLISGSYGAKVRAIR